MVINSIQKEIDGSEAIPTIKLFLQSPNKTVIVVEGDDDVRLFSKFVSEQTLVQKSKEGGWTEVLKVLEACPDEHVIGIRDADFTELISVDKKHTNRRMFHTDCHDAEMMVISVSWESIFHEYLWSKGLDKNDLLTKIFESLIPLSCLKLQNEREGLKLHFEGIGLANFFDGNTFVFDMKNYLVSLNKKSKNKTKIIEENDIEPLENIINEKRNSKTVKKLYEHNLMKFYWCFINGHDFLQCCAICARQHHDTKDVNDKQIARSSRMAYSIEKFSKTDLYKSIKEYTEKTGLSFWKDTNK